MSTKPYIEDENFVPEPTDQFGTLDTSGTAGRAHSRLSEVSPVFDIARKESALQAARALDPKDDSVSPSLVILPEGEGDAKDARDRIAKNAKDSEDVNPLTNRTTASQAEAAEEVKGEDEDDSKSSASTKSKTSTSSK